ncbi:hypothetical protein ACFE04_027138 [Oxalis oulophora]
MVTQFGIQYAVHVINDHFGNIVACCNLLEGLMEHGRLTIQQMLDRAKSKQKENVNEVTLESLQQTLLNLLSCHYVERCPAPEPLLSSDTEGEAPKKQSAKSKKSEEVKTIEQRVEYAAMPSESLRFALINPGAEQKDGNSSPKVRTGRKRKNVVLEPEEDFSLIEDESMILWRVNSEEFMRRLRHKVCIEKVKTNIDDGAAIVLSAMLEATRNEEKTLKQEYSVPLPVGTIYEEVIKNEAGQALTFDHVQASLGLLENASFLTEKDESYRINFKSLLESAQNDEVELTVLKRYGDIAYRMFRLLSNNGKLVETDKISDVTFVEKKDTPKFLYQLWKDDYLHMERVTVASVKNPFMLWKVDKRTLWGHVLDEMLHSALNMSKRLAFEVEQEKEILELHRDRRIGSLGDRYNRIIKVIMLLKSSQMKLDDAIMLFHDF